MFGIMRGRRAFEPGDASVVDEDIERADVSHHQIPRRFVGYIE